MSSNGKNIYVNLKANNKIMSSIAEEMNMIKNIELGYIDLCSLGITK